MNTQSVLEPVVPVLKLTESDLTVRPKGSDGKTMERLWAFMKGRNRNAIPHHPSSRSDVPVFRRPLEELSVVDGTEAIGRWEDRRDSGRPALGAIRGAFDG